MSDNRFPAAIDTQGFVDTWLRDGVRFLSGLLNLH